MEKPDVDFIGGLSPAVAIQQKGGSKNPRSTVGTATEIYDYLRLLFARIGVPHCVNCGRPISRQTIQQIVDRVFAFPPGTRIHHSCAPYFQPKRRIQENIRPNPKRRICASPAGWHHERVGRGNPVGKK